MRKRSLILTTLLAGEFLLCAPASALADAAKPDNDMQAVLNAQSSLAPKPIETLSAQDARLQPSPADGVRVLMQRRGMNPDDSMGITTEDIRFNDSDGGPLSARIYKPAHANPKKRLPIIVYYHGGGWVLADLNTYDATPREMARLTHAIVISADYRHAPESKFPSAHEDALEAYKWTLAHAESIGGDPTHIAVMGESAGGNLAINTAINARDQRLPMPVYEVLIYPVAGTDMETESYDENADAKPLNKEMMAWFFRNETTKDMDMDDSRLDLIDDADFHGLPPTTVIAAQIDPLRSEDEELVDKLRESGVRTDAKTYSGVTHEFFSMGAVVAKAKDAEERVAKDLRTAFAQTPLSSQSLSREDLSWAARR